MLLTVVSSIAIICSLISLPPQIYHMYKIKSGDGVSMFMLVNFLICSAAWLLYGFLTDTISVWFTNIIMFIFWLMMIGLKLYYARK